MQSTQPFMSAPRATAFRNADELASLHIPVPFHLKEHEADGCSRAKTNGFLRSFGMQKSRAHARASQSPRQALLKPESSPAMAFPAPFGIALKSLLEPQTRFNFL
jgi:hypothetical protein